MFKNMKLSAKLIGGFVVVAIITAVVGVIGYWGVISLNSRVTVIGRQVMPALNSIQNVQKELESLRVVQRTLLSEGLTPEERQAQYKNLAEVRKRYGNQFKVYEELPKHGKEKEVWDKFLPLLNDWKATNDETFKLAHDLDEIHVLNPNGLQAKFQEIRGDHYKLMLMVDELVAGGEEFEGGESHDGCLFGKYLQDFANSDESKNQIIASAIRRIIPVHKMFHVNTGKIKELARQPASEERDSKIKELYGTLHEAASKTFEEFRVIRKEITRAQELMAVIADKTMNIARDKQKKAVPLLTQLVEINQETADEQMTNAESEGANAKFMTVCAVIGGVIIALAFGILLSTTISRALIRIIEGLNMGSEQVAAASGQISSASQSLSEGATEQAASLEESSSALEEMASMTRQNADNAQTANQNMTQTNEQVGNGAVAVKNMAGAMGEINQSSEEVSKIIRTIEEIAFQTNLLALNAAVEAARAGDAGKGFAVVADEVRNLAQRSAQAARDTADLIEGTVARVKNGSEIVTQLEASFTEIEESVNSVTSLVAEISAASQEQAQGVDQVNTAVAQMDKVTQQNAANAEESASASEELNAQADQLRDMVGELVTLVGGSTAQAGRGTGSVSKKVSSSKPRLSVSHTSHEPKAAISHSEPNVVKPNDLIPLDDDDFNEF